jgi:hypothetical protein
LEIARSGVMQHNDFLKYMRSVNVGQHVFPRGRGSEENVKVKIIVPLLQALGWDLLEDIYFENSNVDIVLVENNIPQIIVETKSWGGVIEKRHLSQCLEYAINLKVPWIVISTGQFTEVHCAYIDPKNFPESKPIIEFRFDELTKDDSLIRNLMGILGKPNFLNDSAAELVRSRLGRDEFEKLKREFEILADSVFKKSPVPNLSHERILELIKKHDAITQDAITKLWETFQRIVEGNPGVFIIEYGKIEATLKCHLTWPRKRAVSLARISFARGEFYKVEGWIQLNCVEIHNSFKKIPTKPAGAEWVSDICDLLIRGVRKIKSELAPNV